MCECDREGEFKGFSCSTDVYNHLTNTAKPPSTELRAPHSDAKICRFVNFNLEDATGNSRGIGATAHPSFPANFNAEPKSRLSPEVISW